MDINPLLKAADVLEKVAAIFDKEEVVAQEKRAASLKSDFLDPIKEAYPEAGSSLSEKLANTDPEILALIKKAAPTQVTSDYDFGAGASEKLASDYSEDDALLAFCSAED